MQFGASASVAATSIEGITLRTPHSLRPCTVRMRQFRLTSGESILKPINVIRNERVPRCEAILQRRSTAAFNAHSDPLSWEWRATVMPYWHI
jgi:hypothetical protein